jgi:outer membrane protein assembly factor BamB
MNIIRIVSAFLISASAAFAADWPHIAGPTFDRKSSEKVAPGWPGSGPRKLWEISAGGGFSSFVTGNGKAYTIVPIAARETVIALDRKSGKTLWQTPMGPTGYRNGGEKGAPGNEGADGPRGTPVFSQNRVFAFGGKFDLYALDGDTGKILWKHELTKEFGGQEIVWSNAASPLVLGDRVLVAGGGKDQSYLAFRADNGEVLWKAGSDRPTHSTPIVATIHGKEQVLFMAERGIVSRDPVDGRELWHYPFPHRTSTAASPVVWQDIVNCAAAYGVGGAACQVKRNGEQWETVELWRSPGNDTATHWSTAIAIDGYLYGHYGHRDFAKNSVKCIDIRTGKIQWEKPGFGPSQMILAGDRLLATTDSGDLVAIEPTPSGYHELSRAKAITGKVWASPALSDGQLFLRSTSKGVCLEVAPAAARTSPL